MMNSYTTPQPPPPQQQQPQQQESTPLEELVQQVIEHPEDFTKFEQYVNRREQEQQYEGIKTAYEKLLTEYPLLYGYWKRYADLELHYNPANVTTVYERGVSSVPQCVELWTQYCTYVAERSQDLEEIRRLFERAVGAVGCDFLSAPLWERYIEFEVSQEAFTGVLNLYTRILQIPLKTLAQNWENFKQFVASKATSQLLSPDELKSYLSMDEEARKREIISQRERIYERTNEEYNRIITYETGIERPYFHVQPVNATELNTWRSYLQSEEQVCDANRVIYLYEKCLVACAFYVEFWKRYAYYLESLNRKEDARNVLTRAVSVHLKRRPLAYVALAEFEEQNGDVNRAAFILKEVVAGVGKGHIETVMKLANFYRRHNMLSDASKLFEDQISSINDENKPLLLVHFALFTYTAFRDQAQTRSIFERAVSQYPNSKYAWLAYIEYETRHLGDQDWSTIVKPIFERVVQNQELSNENKVTILQKYSDQLNYSAQSVDEIRRVDQIIVRLKTPTVNHKKRKNESTAEENGSAKVPRQEQEQDTYSLQQQ